MSCGEAGSACGCAGCSAERSFKSDLPFGLARATAVPGASDFWLANDALAQSPSGLRVGDAERLAALQSIARDSADLGASHSMAHAMTGLGTGILTSEQGGGGNGAGGVWSGWGAVGDALGSALDWWREKSRDWRWVFGNLALTFATAGRIPFIFIGHASDEGKGGIVKGNVCCPKSLTIEATPGTSKGSKKHGRRCGAKMHLKVVAEYRDGRFEGKNCDCSCCETRQYVSGSRRSRVIFKKGKSGFQDITPKDYESNPDYPDAWRARAATEDSLVSVPDSEAYLTVYDLGADAPRAGAVPPGVPSPDTFPRAGRHWVLDQGWWVKDDAGMHFGNFYAPKTDEANQEYLGPDVLNDRNKAKDRATTFGATDRPVPAQTPTRCKITYEDPLEVVSCLNPKDIDGAEASEAWGQVMLRWVIRPKRKEGCEGGDTMEASAEFQGRCYWPVSGRCITQSVPGEKRTIRGS